MSAPVHTRNVEYASTFLMSAWTKASPAPPTTVTAPTMASRLRLPSPIDSPWKNTGYRRATMKIPATTIVAAVQRCEQAYNRIRDEIAKSIIGQDEVIEQTLVAIF